MSEEIRKKYVKELKEIFSTPTSGESIIKTKWGPMNIKDYFNKLLELRQHSSKLQEEQINVNKAPQEHLRDVFTSKIVFDKNYHIVFLKALDSIVQYIPVKTIIKSDISKTASTLFEYSLKNGMDGSQQYGKSPGMMAIKFIFFALVKLNHLRVKEHRISYPLICSFIPKIDYKRLGIANCRARGSNKVIPFLPPSLAQRYKFLEKNLIFQAQRWTFKELEKHIQELGMKNSGIPGKILSFSKQKGFKLLTSSEYYRHIKGKKSTDIKIKIWCGKKGHNPREMLLSNLIQGKFCLDCANKDRIKYTYSYLLDLAKRRGIEEKKISGMVLDSPGTMQPLKKKTYNKIIQKIRPSKALFWWYCNIKDHPPWKARAQKIESGWCPACSGNYYTFQELKNLAKESGKEETGIAGKILDSQKSSQELKKDTYNKLVSSNMPSSISFWWSCETGHPPFKNSPPNIRRGQWCPICSSRINKNESILGKEFEKIFGAKFLLETYLKDLNLFIKDNNIKIKIESQANKLKVIGYNISFDGTSIAKEYKGKMRFDGYSEIEYNDDLIKIAFEYNGIQHYEFPNYWFDKLSNGKQAWMEYITRDALKKEIAKANGIILIEFPYSLDRYLNHKEKIKKYILSELSKKKARLLE